MYRNLSKQMWQKWWKVEKNDRPDVLIIWGIFKSIAEEGFWSVPEFLMHQFEPYLKNVRRMKLPHTFIGDYQGVNVAVTHAYGGAFSLDQAIQASKLGAKLIILIGHFGGLKDGMEVGKMFVPSAAFRSDGASFHLLGEGDRLVYPTEEIETWVRGHLKERGVPYETGTVKTVSTMVGQTEEMIKEWKRGGFVGVDLESGVIFSAGKKFNLKTVAIMHHSDHVGGGRLMHEATRSQRQAKKQARKLLVELALKAAEKFGK